MKAVILAGGYGTRLSEETTIRPKPMVEVGGRPILWHILKLYSHHGIHDFVILCGYKGEQIKRYFLDYAEERSTITVDLQQRTVEMHDQTVEPWRVTLVDTGQDSLTGERLRRARDYIGDETFCMTYGDGVSDSDITASIAYHREHGALATLTAAKHPGRFGVFTLNEGESRVHDFREKGEASHAWVNGGFFVLEPGALDEIQPTNESFEVGALARIADRGDLAAYRHPGFWQPMDTLRDRNYLETLWASGDAPWKVW